MTSNPVPNGSHEPANSVLPDPTCDLHWSAFRGAIHDIFAQNARKHPGRLFVVETASSTSPRREFTYRQIFEASCQLAHKLTGSGVERDDVVMIYAHRGVDLVVAIFGTLMSGATFSVLDPLYPPDRQVIYLDVSRPRALVVIEKTKGEAGPLSETVRKFIDETLELRTEVPALRLQDNGTLVGGDVDGKDCLADQLSSKEDMPGVVVGPDSTPTLSFTSGSEGRPKGVKGRHFSLAYYFDWMSEQFSLSENDRFTMLSGIAHDPIQRDIFTPAFLGATILVPSKEDIQHEKLAEWMQREGCTVTHLTPAMGQILVGGAVQQFPSLHHAFFVGDILIKRDCRRLQDLAPNVFIISMFGTTETQRAVSYFEIPSRATNLQFLDSVGDVIPVGKGMKDVQLLIVDRENRNRLCNVGEAGEIYVRAGGLAEGYLGLEDLTKEKFMTNWFVDPKKWVEEDKKRNHSQGEPEPWRQFYKGPRDRLYRSGDLGVRRADGNVECTGRADNQVKIRGFRIELGEIDSHLSAHNLVRENVTLLRRDANEEPTLVSYFVPEMERWSKWAEEKERKNQGLAVPSTDESMVAMLKRFRTLRDDIREHLKKKLPPYAVPTVLVPMNRFPLNPNGKIDRPALPFPEPAELAAAAPRRLSRTTATLSDTEKAVADSWAKTLSKGVTADSLEPDSNFFDVGGHSINAQTMLKAIRNQFSVDLRFPTLFQHATLRGFAAEIDRAQDPIGLRLDTNESPTSVKQEEEYSTDAQDQVNRLPKSFQSARIDQLPQQLTVFLTGSTGFLGAFLLRDLLQRGHKVIAHVRLRAGDKQSALDRIESTCSGYGIWSDNWKAQIECVEGDLAKLNLGVKPEVWQRLADTVDVVIHNGAQVHWIYPYSTLRPSNVLSTTALLSLCATSKPKRFGFVSSTSVLDSEHYIQISASRPSGIPESDDLEGSRRGLGTGYGQSKWASEFIVREAGRRGLAGAIIRPGYVTGDPVTGAAPSDDFLVRLLKGCVQVGARPAIENTINQVPVTHVARVVVAATLTTPELRVAQVTARPRLTFAQFTGALETYGYGVPSVPYAEWSGKVEDYVEATGNQGKEKEHALLPLYDMVTTSLPTSSKAPELEDANAAEALRVDAKVTGEDLSKGAAVTEEVVGVYLSYLVQTGFMPKPSGEGRPLPEVKVTEAQRGGKVGGRGGARD